MGLSRQFTEQVQLFKKEWKFFWEAVFELKTQFKTQKRATKTHHKKPAAVRPKLVESLPWLSMQRQRLNLRHEEITKEIHAIEGLDFIDDEDQNKLSRLHDEGQAINERIEEIAAKIAERRASKRVKQIVS